MICIFPSSHLAIDPIPNVVELWQAEEGELLMPAQVRKLGEITYSGKELLH